MLTVMCFRFVDCVRIDNFLYRKGLTFNKKTKQKNDRINNLNDINTTNIVNNVLTCVNSKQIQPITRTQTHTKYILSTKLIINQLSTIIYSKGTGKCTHLIAKILMFL